MRAPIILSLFLSLGAGLCAPAFAAPKAPGALPKLDDHQMHQVYRAVGQARLAGVRSRARFFSKITVGKDWSNEHVLFHDGKVTAFLDMSDPSHPRYDRENVDEDEDMAKIPEAKRAHILVVPNQPREHIGASMTGPITLADINATKEVLEAAHKLAGDLGITNARIYVNPADRLMIGYLHVHIVGERGQKAYPMIGTK